MGFLTLVPGICSLNSVPHHIWSPWSHFPGARSQTEGPWSRVLVPAYGSRVSGEGSQAEGPESRVPLSRYAFKIGAHKNFSIFWIKMSHSNSGVFLFIAKFLRTAFWKNPSGGCFCIFKKVIKSPFCKDVNGYLEKCPCYYVLIIFFWIVWCI